MNHAGLCVTDLERASAFYVGLGFRVERDLRMPDQAAGWLLDITPPVGLRARYLRLGAFTLELMVFDRDGNPAWRERAANEPGLTHLSISVADLPGTVERMEELGGEVLRSSPQVALLRDPDGQLVELLPMSYRASLGG